MRALLALSLTVSLAAAGCGGTVTTADTAAAPATTASTVATSPMGPGGATTSGTAGAAPTTPSTVASTPAATVPSVEPFPQANEIQALFDGIPQAGAVVGSPSAPVKIVEYIDYKCPVCAQASTSVIPALVKGPVRAGEVSLELRPLAFLGPDSPLGAYGGFAAARQNVMWQYTELMMANQGPESSVWITPETVVRGISSAGGDPSASGMRYDTPGATAQLARNDREAQRDGVTGTPTFVVTGPGGGREVVVGPDLSAVNAAIAKVSAG